MKGASAEYFYASKTDKIIFKLTDENITVSTKEE